MKTYYVTPKHGNHTIAFRYIPAVGTHQPGTLHGDHGVDSIVLRDGEPVESGLRREYPGCQITRKTP